MGIGGDYIERKTRISVAVSIRHFESVAIKRISHSCASLINGYAHIFSPKFRPTIGVSRKECVPIKRGSVKVFIHIHKFHRGDNAIARYKTECGFISKISYNI